MHSFVIIVLQFWDWMYNFAQQYGYFGVFVISLVGAISIVFPIPYTLLIYLLGAVLDPFFLAIAGGVGSAIGEFSGYVLGYYGRVLVGEDQQRKMDYMLKFFYRYGSVAIFLFALTPLPDDLLFIPLGIMRYKFLKAFIPCFLGKISMCFILAYSGRLSIDIIRVLFGGDGFIVVVVTSALLVAIMVAMLKIDWEKLFEKYVGEGVERKK